MDANTAAVIEGAVVSLVGKPNEAITVYNICVKGHPDAAAFDIDMISPRLAHDLGINFVPDGTEFGIEITFPGSPNVIRTDAVVFEMDDYDLALRPPDHSVGDLGGVDNKSHASNNAESVAGNDDEAEAEEETEAEEEAEAEGEEMEPEIAGERALFCARPAVVSPDQGEDKIACQVMVENEGALWIPQDYLHGLDLSMAKFAIIRRNDLGDNLARLPGCNDWALRPARVHMMCEKPVTADRAMTVAVECDGESFRIEARVTKAWPEASGLDGYENAIVLVFFE